jgi:hypothetical protein
LKRISSATSSAVYSSSEADLVEVDGELGGVERAVLAQVLAQLDDVVPGLERGHVAVTVLLVLAVLLRTPG